MTFDLLSHRHIDLMSNMTYTENMYILMYYFPAQLKSQEGSIKNIFLVKKTP